jgi:high-affinity K+ transport system ATPase subunit B
MFVVYVGSVMTSLLFLQSLFGQGASSGFILAISVWLWFTVLFANFAESLAEGRSKAGGIITGAEANGDGQKAGYSSTWHHLAASGGRSA